MAAAYTSAESEIEDRRRRLLHRSAHKMPITAQAGENHTMLLPVLNGIEISLTKNPQWKIFPSFGQLNRARQQSASKATRQQPLLGFVCSFVGARMVVKGTASHFQRLIIKEQLEGYEGRHILTYLKAPWE